jgi:hypothetical protein
MMLVFLRGACNIGVNLSPKYLLSTGTEEPCVGGFDHDHHAIADGENGCDTQKCDDGVGLNS